MIKKTLLILIIIAVSLSACKLKLSEYPYNAAEFTQKYYLYERKADRQFLNQEVEVQGVLSQVTRDKENRLVVILARRHDPYGVKCIFTKEESRRKQPLELSKMVTVKGICMGLEEHVILTECVFTEK